jgi:hypothetical protein
LGDALIGRAYEVWIVVPLVERGGMESPMRGSPPTI